MEFMNWISDHWVLSLTIMTLASATYTLPRIVAAVVTAAAMK